MASLSFEDFSHLSNAEKIALYKPITARHGPEIHAFITANNCAAVLCFGGWDRSKAVIFRDPSDIPDDEKLVALAKAANQPPFLFLRPIEIDCLFGGSRSDITRQLPSLPPPHP